MATGAASLSWEYRYTLNVVIVDFSGDQGLLMAPVRLEALLAGLEPAARKRMMRELAQQLRRSQQKKIRVQRNPDGTAYEPPRGTGKIPESRCQPGLCQCRI